MIRIVIYDDNEQRRNSLEALLSLTPNMFFAGSFPDCSNVEKNMEELYPDVVLMDIEMPHVDGINGTKRIKQNFPAVRIIMQTVFEDTVNIFAALKSGASGYILKSAGVDTIIKCIEDVNAGGAFMTPSVAMQVIHFFGNEKPQQEDYDLTPKEKEVLKLLSEGKSYKMVGYALNISYSTVNSHVKKVYEKLHVHSLGEAVSMALKNKIV